MAINGFCYRNIYQEGKEWLKQNSNKDKKLFLWNNQIFLKIIIKYFCKKSTGFINDIKTEILLDMYEAKGSM